MEMIKFMLRNWQVVVGEVRIKHKISHCEILVGFEER